MESWQTILVAQTKQARVMPIPASDRAQAAANRPTHELFEETTIDGRRISKSRLTGPQRQRVEFWTAENLGVVTLTKSAVGRMTGQGTPVSVIVSGQQVTSFTLAFNFSSACSGSVTIPGPVAIGMQVPPGPPPFDQPGFGIGWTQGNFEWGVAVAGHFPPIADRPPGSSVSSFTPAATTRGPSSPNPRRSTSSRARAAA